MNKAMLSACLLVGFCLLFTGTSTAQDWPQVRGPGSQGFSDATGLPTTWSTTENVVWRTRLPGPGSSSPVALGDRLYVTCYSGFGSGIEGGTQEDLMRHVLCIDAASGEIVWDREIPPVLPESNRVRDHGFTAATPATDGTHLYVFFGKSGVFKLDLDGEVLWQADVGDGLHGWGSGTSPVLYDNLVIVNASVESKHLVALSKETGEEVWRVGGFNMSWSTPQLVETDDGRQELVASVKNTILGIDPATGEELWRCRGIQDYVCPSVVSRNGVAYVIGGRRSHTIAVRTGGRGDVTNTHRVWDVTVGANVSSPVVYDGHLYWVSDRNKHAYCIRLSDGSVVYDQEFPAQPYASLLIADGKQYVVTRRGGTFVLAASPEFRQLARNRLDDQTQFNASPIVANGNLILRSDAYLYCIGGGRR